MHADVHQEKRSKAWADLQPGDFVALARRGGPVHAGTVEDRTADGLIIWIRTGLNERQLFHLEDGYVPAAQYAEHADSGAAREAGSPRHKFKYYP
jgi:hypothetical protein